MPRPNPPRKRPRKRPTPSQAATRADAALTKQTAQSSQPRTPATSERKAAGAASAAPPVDPTEMWSRRSYAILVALMGVAEVLVTALQWELSPASTNGVSKGSLALSLTFLNPISLLVAALIAAPVARMLAHERRPLRVVETLTVGVVTYFISIFLTFAVNALLVLPNPPTQSSGTGPTPCPAGASCAPASSSATRAPSATSSSSASTGTSPSPSAVVQAPLVLSADQTAGFAGADIVSLVLTVYVYPPLYRRFRVRRPVPPPAKGGDRDKRTARPAPKGADKKGTAPPDPVEDADGDGSAEGEEP